MEFYLVLYGLWNMYGLTNMAFCLVLYGLTNMKFYLVLYWLTNIVFFVSSIWINKHGILFSSVRINKHGILFSSVWTNKHEMIMNVDLFSSVRTNKHVILLSSDKSGIINCAQTQIRCSNKNLGTLWHSEEKSKIPERDSELFILNCFSHTAAAKFTQ
jgi:hypothetical protein